MTKGVGAVLWLKTLTTERMTGSLLCLSLALQAPYGSSVSLARLFLQLVRPWVCSTDDWSFLHFPGAFSQMVARYH